MSLDHYLGITEQSPTPYAPDGAPLDPRNSLVLLGRPPEHVLRLASHLQTKLKDVAPSTHPLTPLLPSTPSYAPLIYGLSAPS